MYLRDHYSTKPVAYSQYPETLSLGLFTTQQWITWIESAVPAQLLLADANFHDKSTSLKFLSCRGWPRCQTQDNLMGQGNHELLLENTYWLSLSLSIPPSSKWEKDQGELPNKYVFQNYCYISFAKRHIIKLASHWMLILWIGGWLYSLFYTCHDFSDSCVTV